MQYRRKRKLRRFLLGLFIVLAILMILIAFLASPIVKHLAEKHDIEFTGREISIGSLFINPVSASVTLRNLLIYEQNSDTVFFSVRKFTINMALRKLISGVYDVSSIKVIRPEVRILRDDTLFNFSDLIQKFTVAEDTIEEEKIHLNLRNITVSNGAVFYSDSLLPSGINISEINFHSSGMLWDVDTVTGDYSFNPGGGHISGDFMVNKESLDYRLAVGANDFDLGMLGPLIDTITGKASFTAGLDMDLRASGNINQLMQGKAEGRFDITDFHFGMDPENDFLSFDRFLFKFPEIDLKEKVIDIDSVLIVRPSLLYEMYDTLDNFRRMFKTFLGNEVEEELEEEADTVKQLIDLKGADYRIVSFRLSDGRMQFNDYSIAEKFTFVLHDFNIRSDSVESSDKRIRLQFNGKIYPAGGFGALLSINPENDENFNFSYEFRNIPATLFNPYITTYSSYQLDRGTVEMHGDWRVTNSRINSLNHFLVIDPRTTKRAKDKDNRWIPLPLIMTFARERGGAIDYQIPVKGDLENPDFSLRDVISDLLRNILVKPPTTPYGMQVKNVQQKIEKTLTVKWKMRQINIDEDQEKFMKSIAEFLQKNPEASIVVQPVFHVAKEKENILLFEAKKKYYFTSRNRSVVQLSDEDSMKIERMNSRDSSFIRFMNKSLKSPGLLTLQEKCARFIGNDVVDKKYTYMAGRRKDEFLKFFNETNTGKRVEILDIKNEVPYNWFSYYRLSYKGDVPDELAEAFEKLYEINAEPPRRKFFEFLRK